MQIYSTFLLAENSSNDFNTNENNSKYKSQSTKSIPLTTNEGIISSQQNSMVLSDSMSTMVSNNTVSSINLSRSCDDNSLLDFFFSSENEKTKYTGEYVNDIYNNLLNEEKIQNPKNIFGFMKRQQEINEQMRAILIDWIIDVHLRFRLRTSSLFTTVKIIDHYLNTNQIQRNNFQLLGIAAFLIACKHDEIFIPKLEDLIYVTDNAYKKEELVKMEEIVLDNLSFNILGPSPLDFYEILAKSFGFKKVEFYLGRFFMESFLLDINYTKYSPSVIACACAYIVMKYYKLPNYQKLYDKRLNSEGVSQTFIKETAKEICFFIDGLSSTDLKATRNKYSLAQYGEVSNIHSNSSK